jgi:hypothetical protein
MNDLGGRVRTCSNGRLAVQKISKIVIRRSTAACVIRRVFSKSGFGIIDLTLSLVFAYEVVIEPAIAR